jgi:diguanylate cyclase (GGDEF)-like protein
MMIATGLAAMHALFSAPAEKKASYRGTASREASGYVSLTMSGASWRGSLARTTMANESPVRTRAMPVTPVRAPSGRPVRDDPAPHTAQPTRNIPSELAVLLNEVQRLEAELAGARAKVKELEATADIDAVTGIFNRRGFDRELARSLSYVKRYGTRAALFYLDLDGFKPVNDQHGHAAGDAVLRAIAELLTRNVRASDTVARLGGDEFGLILWNLSEGDAAAKAWALEAAIGDAAVEWQGQILAVGASIGFAMFGPADELAPVLARADHAMYARKAERKGGRSAENR